MLPRIKKPRFVSGGKIPYDDIRIVEVEKVVSTGLLYSMITLTTMGAIVSICFLWFNVAQRNTR